MLDFLTLTRNYFPESKESMSTATKIRKTGKYHHGDLRAALIEATRHLIEEKGIDHFSVTDACRLAGVSTAAPYKHFKNKEEMVAAATLEAIERQRNELLESLKPLEPGSIDRIVALGRNYIDSALREPAMFQHRFAQCDTPMHPQILENGEGIYTIVKNEVAKALGEPGITDLVEHRAFLLWNFVHGFSHIHLVPEFAEKAPKASLDDLLYDIAERVLKD